MPTPSQGTIGSLDYRADERKKLAKKSLTFSCSDCGSTVHLLKTGVLADEEKKVLDEAKEVIKKMSIKVGEISRETFIKIKIFFFQNSKFCNAKSRQTDECNMSLIDFADFLDQNLILIPG